MNDSLARSYAYCERLARREAGNFYPAFRLLPQGQRRAMCALYAFLRIADDLGDNPGDLADKRARLDEWRCGLDLALTGRYEHPLHEALGHTVAEHRIPVEYLHDVLDGVEMDLTPMSYDTFEALRLYCYRVASAVGLACIHIWGFSEPRARDHAESAGVAFQLTNILRDLGEDAGRGRLYLPAEDLARFGYDPQALRRGERDDRFRALMRFEVERARGFYQSSEPLAELLPPAGRAVFLVLTRTYRALLDAIEGRDYDVFSRRVSVSPWRKMFLALQALPVRWGWMNGAR
jgi:phytoene synthase